MGKSDIDTSGTVRPYLWLLHYPSGDVGLEPHEDTAASWAAEDGYSLTIVTWGDRTPSDTER